MLEALIGAAAAAILTLLGAIYSYGRLTKTVEGVEKKVEVVEKKVDKVELQMSNHVAHHLERLEPILYRLDGAEE